MVGTNNREVQSLRSTSAKKRKAQQSHSPSHLDLPTTREKQGIVVKGRVWYIYNSQNQRQLHFTRMARVRVRECTSVLDMDRKQDHDEDGCRVDQFFEKAPRGRWKTA